MSLWLEAMGASVQYYDAGGVRTRVLQAGSGEAVIFLHGIGGHLEAFAKNIFPMSDRYHAIAVDMVGHGLTEKPDIDYMPPAYAEHILALMDQMGIERAHFVGESLGAWAAFCIIEDFPERALSYTSLVGAGLQVGEFDNYSSAGVQQLRARSANAAAEPSRESIRARLEWLFHEPQLHVSDELVDVRLHFWSSSDMRRVQPKISRLLDPQLAAGHFITEARLRRIKTPSYFLWTEFNPTTPWKTAELAASFVDRARFDVMPRCGHWPQYEDPDEFHLRMRSFFSSVAQRQAA